MMLHLYETSQKPWHRDVSMDTLYSEGRSDAFPARLAVGQERRVRNEEIAGFSPDPLEFGE